MEMDEFDPAVDGRAPRQAVNPGLQYVCDPVLGDDGRCYVPEELVEMYKCVISVWGSGCLCLQRAEQFRLDARLICDLRTHACTHTGARCCPWRTC